MCARARSSRQRGESPSKILHHEVGHLFGFASQPTNYVNACSTLHNCQDSANRNSLQSESTMDWQERYELLKKYYPIPQNNFYKNGSY